MPMQGRDGLRGIRVREPVAGAHGRRKFFARDGVVAAEKRGVGGWGFDQGSIEASVVPTEKKSKSVLSGPHLILTMLGVSANII